jgi:hypothetical protein
MPERSQLSTPITLQISLPAEVTLSDEELASITGRERITQQMKWLDEHGWAYALDADKGVIVGKLYAHLRLAGLHPVDVASAAAAGAGGFKLDATR